MSRSRLRMSASQTNRPGNPPDRGRGGTPSIDPRVLVALLAAVIGLACSVVAFIGPADREQTRITWRPASAGLNRPLALLGAYPQRLSVALSCATVRTLPGPTTLVKTATDPVLNLGFALVSDLHTVWVDVGTRNRLLKLPVPRAGPCAVTAGFVAEDDRGRLSLRVGSRTVARDLVRRANAFTQVEETWPRVVGLHADPALRQRPDVVLKLETTPTGSSPSPRQIVAMSLALLALGVAGAAVVRARPRNQPASPSQRAPAAERSPLLAASDLVVLGIAVAALVGTPPFFDDGWIRAGIDFFPKLGSFTEYYTTADFAKPLGYAWSWLTYAWSGASRRLSCSASDRCFRSSPHGGSCAAGSWTRSCRARSGRSPVASPRSCSASAPRPSS